MPRSARLLVLLASLLALFAPATASATHWDDDPSYVEDDPSSYEEPGGGEDEQWQPPAQPPADPPAQPPADAGPPSSFDPPDADPWDGGGGWERPEIPRVTTPTVAGRRAMMRTDGKAAVPRGAPRRIRDLIRAINEIVGKPYKWGGGHARLVDRGYDCSGAVGYGLIKVGLQIAPMVSGSYKRWGAAGAGRHVTVYANRGHVYMEVAGLRLDTSAAGDWDEGRKGVRWRPVTGRRRGFTVRHPVGL